MKRAAIITIAFVTLLPGVVYIATPADPKYNRRTLTSYLEGPWEQIDGPQTENPHFAPDAKAIRAIGTNGIPTLLRLIEAHDPAWCKEWFALLKSQGVVHFEICNAKEKRELGCLGFYILGNIAKPAVPELLKLLNHPAFEVRVAATNCLREIEPPLSQ